MDTYTSLVEIPVMQPPLETLRGPAIIAAIGHKGTHMPSRNIQSDVAKGSRQTCFHGLVINTGMFLYLVGFTIQFCTNSADSHHKKLSPDEQTNMKRDYLSAQWTFPLDYIASGTLRFRVALSLHTILSPPQLIRHLRPLSLDRVRQLWIIEFGNQPLTQP